MFLLSKIIALVTAPDVVLLLAVLVGTALLWTRRQRTGRRLLAVGTAGMFLVAVLPLGGWLILPLENRFPTIHQLPEHVDGIVVLGSAVNQRVTEAHGQPALNGTAERMTEFVALARQHPEAKLVFTGGSALIDYPELKEATVARQLFASLGMDVTRVVFEDQSRNTYENALYTRDLMKPKPGETWVLITSAFHMPRAYGCFSQVGWKVLPYPVDYMTLGYFRFTVDFALAAGLDGLGFAIHEWVGLTAYRILGRTDALFPSPP